MRWGCFVICAARVALVPTLLAAGPIPGPLERIAPLAAEDSPGSAQGPSDVTVPMGAVTMRIPKEYFFSPPRHEGHGPDAIDFSLLSLLPDFAPPTAANFREFNGGWHHQVLISISYNGYLLTGAALLSTWYSYSHHATVKPGPYGYLYFEHSGFDELFRGSLENPTDIVSCRPASGPLSPPSPSCERIVQTGRDITAQYSFSRSYLDEVQSLDTQVVAFLNRFRVSGPSFRIVQ
jgi:hypothetical protein